MKIPAYQFKIGVSGHRELENIESIKSAVESLMTQIKELVGDENRQTSSLAEFVVISSLAKGADQLVTQAAIENLNAKVEFVSPLPVEDYRPDFVESQERELFHSFVEMDDNPTILNEHGREQPFSAGSDERKQAYLDAGQYVVESCEILIVIWDGEPAKGLGGTGDVVEYAMKRNRVTLWINSKEPGLPIQLLVPTPNHSSSPAGCQPRPFPDSLKQLSLGFHRYRAFVRDSIVAQATVDKAAIDFLNNLNVTADSSGFAEEKFKHANDLSVLMAKSDQMAIAYQKRYLFAAKSLFRLSALAVTIAVFQVLFFPHQLWLILFEIAAMILAASLLLYSRREAWHEKWLNDRYIAEWLRCQLFLGVLPQTEQNSLGPENRLPFYPGPDEWFRSAFSPSITRYNKSMQNAEFTSVKRFLIDHWLRSQADWHAKNAKKKERLAVRYETAGTIFFAVTILMAILHFFGVGHKPHTPEQIPHQKSVEHQDDAHDEGHDATHENHAEHPQSHRLEDISLWITFLAIILPAWGAANHAVASMLEYERIAKRSEKMAALLHEIAERAGQCRTQDAFSELVAQAAILIETENREWMVSLSFQGLKLPA